MLQRPTGADPGANAAGRGLFVAIPFGLAAAVALLVASIQSLVGWRDLRLVALLALSAGFGDHLGRWWSFEWAPWCAYGLASLALAMTPAPVLRRPVSA